MKLSPTSARPDPPSAHILLVEDDKALRTVLERALRFDGYQVTQSNDGATALEALTDTEFDAVILDIGLPNIDGLSLCRLLRDRGRDEPVMMLTARTDVPDRVAGLDAGADDYVTKPFSVDELLARLRAMLRRPSQASTDTNTIEVAGLVLDTAARTVRYQGARIELTKLEFDLLAFLSANADLVVDRDRIYERIWGFDFETNSRALDVTISYLRTKLESDGRPRLIQTVRGIGYTIRSVTP